MTKTATTAPTTFTATNTVLVWECFPMRGRTVYAARFTDVHGVMGLFTVHNHDGLREAELLASFGEDPKYYPMFPSVTEAKAFAAERLLAGVL